MGDITHKIELMNRQRFIPNIAHMLHIEERPLGANMSQLYNNSPGMGSAVAILKQSLLHNKFSEEQKKDVTRTPASGAAAAAPPSPIQSADLDKTIFGVLSKSAMTPEEFNTRKNLVLDGLNNFAQKCKELQGLAASQAQTDQALEQALAQDQANVENIIFGDQVLAQDQDSNIQGAYLATKRKDSRISKRKKQSF